MKYTIFIRGKNWSFQLARALDDKQKLKYLVTSYPKFYIEKFNVNRDKIKSVIVIEILSRILSKLFKFLKKIKIKFDHQLFIESLSERIYSSFYLKKTEFCILGFGNCSLKIINKAKKLNIKTIYFLNNSSPDFRKKLRLEYKKLGLLDYFQEENHKITQNINESIKKADFVGAISTFQKKTYVDSGILDPSKVLQLHTIGFDPNIFYTKNYNKKKFIVTAVGNDFIRKGFKYLVDGFNKLDLENSELWIIGNNDINLINKIVKLKKNNYFFKANQLDLPDYYNKSSIFCLPTLEEGAPAVIGEAMACGLPILVTKNCQGPDVIDNEKNGFIIEEQNSDIIAERIKFFYDNPQVLVNMSNAASNYAHTNMTIDFQVSKIVDFIEKNK